MASLRNKDAFVASINLPDWYDELAEFECESKGCALNFNVFINGDFLLFNFYDVYRFSQDCIGQIADFGYFKDENAVILSEVTKNNIEIYLNSLCK